MDGWGRWTAGEDDADAAGTLRATRAAVEKKAAVRLADEAARLEMRATADREVSILWMVFGLKERIAQTAVLTGSTGLLRTTCCR